MSTKSALDQIHVNVKNGEASPPRKRTRVDPSMENQVNELQSWSILNSDVYLNDMAEAGVKRLESDSPDEHVEDDKYPDFLDLSLSSSNKARAERDNCIAMVLQSALSKETMQKLTAGEWDEVLVYKKPKRELIFKIDHFQHLSDEVILHILHWLPKRSLANAALVCRRWHRLAQDESLWTRMDVSNRYLEPGALGHILSRQAIILRVANSEICHPPILYGVKAALPDFRARLLYLDLSMAHISPDSLVMLFSKCQRLKKLSMEHLTVNDNVLLALSRNRELEVLNLCMAEGLEKDGLSYLLTNCRKLKELNIAWTYMTSDCVGYICCNLPQSIDRINLSGSRKLMDDENVLDLVTSCPNLRELDLSDCTGLTGRAITHIVELQDLNFLALSRCYFIPYRSLLQLRVVGSLTYLDVHGGYIDSSEFAEIQAALGTNVTLNKFKFSSVARPTVGPHRSSIWGLRVRD